MISLSDSLTEVTIKDLKWAIENNYETDVKWVALNLVSLLSSKHKPTQKRSEFKELVNHSLYTTHIHPMCLWSGWYNDLVELTAVLTNKSFVKKDAENNYYMWIYNSNKKLIQVPQQLLKEQLILWDNLL